MKEKPSENRIYTGSDKDMSAEQAHNLIRSPEFDQGQKNRIRALIDGSEHPQDAAVLRDRQVFMAFELIRGTKDGDLMINILKCCYAGYSHKKIAKTLMKSERSLPTFSSLGKAIKFVQEAEREGKYRVSSALAKRRTFTI